MSTSATGSVVKPDGTDWVGLRVRLYDDAALFDAELGSERLHRGWPRRKRLERASRVVVARRCLRGRHDEPPGFAVVILGVRYSWRAS